MTIKSRIVGILSLGLLTVGGSALAAPGPNQSPRPPQSEARPNQGPPHDSRNAGFNQRTPAYGPAKPLQQRLSPREAQMLRDAERQISQGQDKIELGRAMVRRGERTRDRQLIRKGERLMKQGRDQLSQGHRLKMRVLA